MINIKKKSEIFSLDVLVAAGIFMIGIILFFYVLTHSGKESGVTDLAAEGERATSMLLGTNSSSAVIVHNKVEKDNLMKLANLSKTVQGYMELKAQLGITSDFCIHFEDENGNLVDIDDSPGRTRYSIGSPRLNYTVFDGTREINMPCGNWT